MGSLLTSHIPICRVMFIIRSPRPRHSVFGAVLLRSSYQAIIIHHSSPISHISPSHLAPRLGWCAFHKDYPALSNMLNNNTGLLNSSTEKKSVYCELHTSCLKQLDQKKLKRDTDGTRKVKQTANRTQSTPRLNTLAMMPRLFSRLVTSSSLEEIW